MITTQDIAERFGNTNRETTDEQVDKLESVMNKCAELALHLLLVVPDGREQALAITKLEEVQMWANAGIDRNG
jgi:hypothetical protein